MNYDSTLDCLVEILKRVNNEIEITENTPVEDIVKDYNDILEIALDIDSTFYINCDYEIIELAETVLQILEHILELLEK